MAKIQFGAVATDARGKIAGIVYSKNQFGGYVRVKVSPTQAPTTRRSTVRSRLAGLAAFFSSQLTLAQVAAWNSFAKNNPIPDVFGNPKFLSGVQAFCQLNAVILNAGGTQIDDPPAGLSVDTLTSVTVTATVGAPDVVTIAFTPTPLTTGMKLSVFATQGLPIGRSFTKPFMRWIGVSAAAQASPYNAASAYLAKFGALIADTKVGFRCNVVNSLTGAQGVPYYITNLIA